MHNTITTPRQFFNRVVVPDIEALKTNPHDVRLAFHASTSIHQLREWVFKANLTTHQSLSEYSQYLYARCTFLYSVRTLASNAKHFPPGEAEILVVGTSAVSAHWDTPIVRCGESDQSMQLQVIAQKQDGSKEWMIPTIMEGFQFWQNEFDVNGW
jgi:hypothetical protein